MSKLNKSNKTVQERACQDVKASNEADLRAPNSSENASARAEAVAAFRHVIERSVDYAINSKLISDLYGLSKAPLELSVHSHPYIRMLSESGFNKATALLFRNVTRNNLSEFIESPSNFVTVNDMMIVKAMYGITMDRQIQVLVMGITTSERLARKERYSESFAALDNRMKIPEEAARVFPIIDSITGY